MALVSNLFQLSADNLSGTFVLHALDCASLLYGPASERERDSISTGAPSSQCLGVSDNQPRLQAADCWSDHCR